MAGREMVVNFPGPAPVLGQAKAACGLVLASGANSERPANRQGCVRPKMATLKRPQHQRLMLQLHPICSTVRHSDTSTSDSSPVCTITNAYLSCHPNHGAAFERAHSSPSTSPTVSSEQIETVSTLDVISRASPNIGRCACQMSLMPSKLSSCAHHCTEHLGTVVPEIVN
jgi:hypothetical protein